MAKRMMAAWISMGTHCCARPGNEIAGAPETPPFSTMLIVGTGEGALASCGNLAASTVVVMVTEAADMVVANLTNYERESIRTESFAWSSYIVELIPCVVVTWKF